jgi:hypothetical protein
MEVLVIFWNNSDNFIAVIKRSPFKTIREQLNQYEYEHNYAHDSLIGVEYTITD